MTTRTAFPSYSREYAATLQARLQEPRRYMQVVEGPRQVGKTTLVRQVLFRLGSPDRFVSADEPTLKDAGNTTTLAHYLDLLAGVGMLTGLPKFAGEAVRQRGSSPKLQVFNTALLTAVSEMTPAETAADREFWARLTESAVGAHLANAAFSGECDVFYWRDRNREVDFVVRVKHRLLAIEVKSGRSRSSLRGLAAFEEEFRPHRTLIVGTGGIGLEDFLSRPVSYWLKNDHQG